MIEHDNFTLLGSGQGVHDNETCSPIAVHSSRVSEHLELTMQHKQHERSAAGCLQGSFHSGAGLWGGDQEPADVARANEMSK